MEQSHRQPAPRTKGRRASSVTARVTLFALAILLAASVALGVYVSHMAPGHELERRLVAALAVMTLLSMASIAWMIRRQLRPLAHSELLYSTAFRTSPDAFTITRLDDGTFLNVNDSFTRMFGWTAQEIVGRRSSDVGLWHDPSNRNALLEALAASGRCDALETEFKARDGRILSVEITATLMTLNGADCMLAVTHDITSRKKAQHQIETLAFSDPLTGLPNRRLFMDRLHQALPEAERRGQRGALLLLDLDDFKTLNDSLGHDRGDMLLRALGRRLLSAVSAGDTVARLVGDEFVVLLKDLGDDDAQALAHARSMGETLLDLIAQPIRINEAPYHGTASMGLSLFGTGEDSPAELLKRADLAMHHAKSAGRGQLAVFDPRMQQVLATRSQLEAGLRAALDEGQLRLHYQPKVDAGGRITGVEGLVRWQHPQRGMIPPGEFIPVAERCGLIVALGDWVILTACRQLAAWAADPALARLTLAVNVSSRQFQQDDFVAKVLETLDATGADARRLQLELTESLLVESLGTVASHMQTLKHRGVCFALDDFGTGFSSLAYLKRLPLDELKIDQGFVREIEHDANDLAIAGTVVALGRSLRLQVVAEGVETEGQRRALAQVGCLRYQGYLFGRPMPAEELEPRVRESASRDDWGNALVV